MPKEHRKRGKKKKPEPEWQPPVQDPPSREPESVPQQVEESPSWIVSAPKHATTEEDVNPEAPFGYVDADVKAYFRTVDIQIRDWQDSAAALGPNEEDTDPNEGALENISS
jgi:nucleolar protein 9